MPAKVLKHAEACTLQQASAINIGTTIIFWMISLCNENMQNARWPGNQPSARIGSQCRYARIRESQNRNPHRHSFWLPALTGKTFMCVSVVQLFYMLTKNAQKNWKVQNWVHICGVRYLSYNSTKIVYNTFWVFGTLLISVETSLEQTSWLARLLWHSSQAALIRGYSRAFLPLPFALPFGSSAFPLPLPFLAWNPQSSKNHCLRSNLDFWG